jgi:hypothetical protein
MTENKPKTEFQNWGSASDARPHSVGPNDPVEGAQSEGMDPGDAYKNEILPKPASPPAAPGGAPAKTRN